MPTASDVDRLFQLPLAEFTAARNALAARLKKAGRAEDADRVKALLKPPVSAWAVNQVYWRHRKAFDRLIAAGERFRKAQAAQLAGKSADMRAPFDERRTAVSELTGLATAVLREGDHALAPDTLRRVTTTLEALATYGEHPGKPEAGRLTDDLDPPGFEALTALVPRGSGRTKGETPPRVIPFTTGRTPRAARKQKLDPAAERQAQLAAAKIAVHDAGLALKEARRAAALAEAALRTAAARAKDAEKAKAEIEKRYEAASADADAARQDARRVASEAEEAAQAVEDAERALDKARREREKLGQ
jgi:hypothetical protein